MKKVKTPNRKAMSNRAGPEPKCQQLSPRNHPMLLSRHPSEPIVGFGQLGLTIDLK
jgi:hypothetical protein